MEIGEDGPVRGWVDPSVCQAQFPLSLLILICSSKKAIGAAGHASPLAWGWPAAPLVFGPGFASGVPVYAGATDATVIARPDALDVLSAVSARV